MDFNDIINKIDEFYRTADEKTLAKVNDAFLVEVEDDISIEEYLSGFNDEYFYTHEDEANCYISDVIQVQPNEVRYQVIEFESASSSYGSRNINIALKTESDHGGKVTKMIKTAA